MSNEKLRNEIWEEATVRYHDGTTKTVRYLHKAALHATKCDACGKIFSNPGNTNPRIVLQMDKEHPSHLDFISFDICSIECGMLLHDGGWRRIDHDPMDDDGQHPFIAIGAEVNGYEVTVVSELHTEGELIDNWNAYGTLPIIGIQADPYVGRGGNVMLMAGQSNGVDE